MRVHKFYKGIDLDASSHVVKLSPNHAITLAKLTIILSNPANNTKNYVNVNEESFVFTSKTLKLVYNHGKSKDFITKIEINKWIAAFSIILQKNKIHIKTEKRFKTKPFNKT